MADCKLMENRVNEIVHGYQKLETNRTITMEDGTLIRRWINKTIVFESDVNIDQQKLEALIIANVQ